MTQQLKTEQRIADLVVQKEKAKNDEPTNIRTIIDCVKYFLEHLEYLPLQQMNPVAKTDYFDLLLTKRQLMLEYFLGPQNWLHL